MCIPGMVSGLWPIHNWWHSILHTHIYIYIIYKYMYDIYKYIWYIWYIYIYHIYDIYIYDIYDIYIYIYIIYIIYIYIYHTYIYIWCIYIYMIYIYMYTYMKSIHTWNDVCIKVLLCVYIYSICFHTVPSPIHILNTPHSMVPKMLWFHPLHQPWFLERCNVMWKGEKYILQFSTMKLS